MILTSLEARIDKLEDYSRRDNLLFTGFAEDRNENCENVVRDILARKLLRGICDVNKVNIVRAHRLGQYKADQTRPIIVKFREFCDKQLILQQLYKGALINTGKWVTEDFSANTTDDRKYLREHLKAAREVLEGQIKTSSVRYKAIYITNIHGKRFVFPLHKIVANSQTWWKVVGAGPETDDISDVISVDGVINSPTQNPTERAWGAGDTTSDTDGGNSPTQSSDGESPPTEGSAPPVDINTSSEQETVVPEPVVQEKQVDVPGAGEGEEEG